MSALLFLVDIFKCPNVLVVLHQRFIQVRVNGKYLSAFTDQLWVKRKHKVKFNQFMSIAYKFLCFVILCPTRVIHILKNNYLKSSANACFALRGPQGTLWLIPWPHFWVTSVICTLHMSLCRTHLSFNIEWPC